MLPQICAWMIFIAFSVPYNCAWTCSPDLIEYAIIPFCLRSRNKIKRNTIMAMWPSQVTAWSVITVGKCHHVLIRNPLNLSLLICYLSFISCLSTCYPNHSPYLFIYFLMLSGPLNCTAVNSTPSLFHRSALSSIFLPLMANNIQNY